MKKLFLALLLPAALALPGCTDEQVAASVGFVGGAIVGSAIGSSYDNYYYEGSYRPYYGRSYYRDYWGNWNYDYGYGYPYGYYSSTDLMARREAPSKTGTIVSSRAANFAMKNKTSFAAGERVVKAFDRGSRGDFSALDRLGMTRDELMTIANGHMPSSHAMAKMGAELNLHASQVRTIMKKVVRKVQEKRASM